WARADGNLRLCGWRVGMWACAAVVLAVGSGAAPAQTPASPQAPAAALAAPAPPQVNVPSFWDPKRRQERPELPASTVIRFLTEINYPPFNFAGRDGNPAGFN